MKRLGEVSRAAYSTDNDNDNELQRQYTQTSV